MNIKDALGIMHPFQKTGDEPNVVVATAKGLVELCQKEELDVELAEITIEDGVFTQWIRVKDWSDLFGVCFDRAKNTYEVITRSGVSNPMSENSVTRFLEDVRNECYPEIEISPHTEEACDGIYSNYLDYIY